METIRFALSTPSVRYLIIGVSTVSLNLVLIYAFRKIGFAPNLANACALLLSFTFNYLMSNYFTYKKGHSKHLFKSSRYIVLSTFNYFTQIFVYWVITSAMNPGVTDKNEFSYSSTTFASLAGALVVTSWNFFLYRYWVFTD